MVLSRTPQGVVEDPFLRGVCLGARAATYAIAHATLRYVHDLVCGNADRRADEQSTIVKISFALSSLPDFRL